MGWATWSALILWVPIYELALSSVNHIYIFLFFAHSIVYNILISPIFLELTILYKILLRSRINFFTWILTSLVMWNTLYYIKSGVIVSITWCHKISPLLRYTFKLLFNVSYFLSFPCELHYCLKIPTDLVFSFFFSIVCNLVLGRKGSVITHKTFGMDLFNYAF